MHVDGDERLKLCPLHLGQFLCRAVDECGQQIIELDVHVLHDFLVRACVLQSDFSVTRPQHLDTQQADLKQSK